MDPVRSRLGLADTGLAAAAGAALGGLVDTPLLIGLVAAVAVVRFVPVRWTRRKTVTPRVSERGLAHPPPADDAADLAVIDALTGLANRRGVERALEDACRAAAAASEPLGVLVFQVRDITAVRRLYGSQAGRDVLRQTGERLSRALGTAGSVGRWGGEEFVAVMPGLRPEAAVLLAERFRRLLEVEPCRLSSGRRVTAAIAAGWAASPRDGVSGAFLVSRAQGRAAAQAAEPGALALG